MTADHDGALLAAAVAEHEANTVPFGAALEYVLVPGKVAEISFDLWATSVLIRAGHRIRVAVAGADADTFLRYPRDGSIPVLSVQRNPTHPSRIVLHHPNR